MNKILSGLFLIKKIGGSEKFTNWLDQFLSYGGQDLRREGLYTPVNEPDILVAFLYVHAGRADKTEEKSARN